MRVTMIPVLLILGTAPLFTAAACKPDNPTPAKACDVRYTGLTVRRGTVVDTVRPVCDVPPASHTLKAVIEFQVGDTWLELGRARIVDSIPDQQGFPIELTTACHEGTYRTHVHVEGVGPAPSGLPFSFDDTGPTRTFTLVQCAE